MLYLTTLLFFATNTPMQHDFLLILYRFSVLFCQKSEKIVKFFAIFSLCVSMIYEKVEKIIAKKS